MSKPPPPRAKRGRPFLPDATRRRAGIMIRPPPDIWMEVQRRATMRGESAGNWVIDAINEKLKRGKT